jgi:hypothetical protein
VPLERATVPVGVGAPLTPVNVTVTGRGAFEFKLVVEGETAMVGVSPFTCTVVELLVIEA